MARDKVGTVAQKVFAVQEGPCFPPTLGCCKDPGDTKKGGLANEGLVSESLNTKNPREAWRGRRMLASTTCPRATVHLTPAPQAPAVRVLALDSYCPYLYSKVVGGGNTVSRSATQTSKCKQIKVKDSLGGSQRAPWRKRGRKEEILRKMDRWLDRKCVTGGTPNSRYSQPNRILNIVCSCP